jgi:hypothetical protein
MPEFRKILDVYQGYNYKKDKQTAVGFITELTLGGKKLTADQNCKNPMKPTEDVKAISVLSDVMWETGVTDAVYFSGQVSITNKQEIMQLIYTALVDVLVEFKFEVYEFDPKAKTYYLCFSSKAAVKGLLEKNGEALNLTVAEDASTQVQSPLNYAFQAGFKPQPEAQTLELAVGDKLNFSKAWGLKIG